VEIKKYCPTLAPYRPDAYLYPRFSMLLKLTTFCAIMLVGANTSLAQSSLAKFQSLLREKTSFDETDFAAVEQGQTAVRLLPVLNKREVAVCGLVSLQAPAEVFLRSFRENMTRKNNAAVLEIGRFSDQPTLQDLQALNIEERDIEDLKDCVVGDCELKLSAPMIERLRSEVNWQAPDYRLQAAQLIKVLLLEYVRDYRTRGDAALIQYNDKEKEVRLADEQRDLMSASGYVNDLVGDLPQNFPHVPKSELSIVEDAIVWSKIKFGLKPVTVINHIVIYTLAREAGPQVLITSKQIYANHYFNSSLALTAFVNIPGATSRSYVVYENRSRADGLEGAFSKFKRGIVENRAVEGLKAILEHSKASFSARSLDQNEAVASNRSGSWRQWTVGGVHLFLWFFVLTALVGLLVMSNYDWKGGISGGARE
jgi:hypothetical protein